MSFGSVQTEIDGSGAAQSYQPLRRAMIINPAEKQ